jgi:hypothetical protein
MLRVIDTETCGLQGGIVEIASVILSTVKLPSHEPSGSSRSAYQPAGDGYPPDHRRDGRR